jgi:protein involved in polysaccharide export with SLBB domain
VDVKTSVSGSVFVACIALCLAQGVLLAATPPPRGDVVQTLTFEPSENGAIVSLKTTVPVPHFSCLLNAVDSHQVVIDFPAATGTLKKRYALDSPLVREALVEKSPEPGVTLRIRLTLAEGVLAAVELGGQGLNLRFQGGAPAPIQDAVASTEYLVGAGDKLDITVLGHADLNRVVEVRGDGTIDFPLIGEVPVAGKGLSQIDREMTRTLGKDYIINPQLSVNIKEYGSQWVTVIGEVTKPGRQLLKQKMRLIDLLAEAGGFTAYANRKQIEILRPENGDLRRKVIVNLKNIEDGKQPDVPMMSGDVVMVPRRTF